MAAGSARETAWHDGARHALEYAIAASLALHALALLSLPALRSPTAPPAAPPPLEARLMPAQPPETHKPAPAPEVEPKPVEPKPAPPEVRKPVPRSKPRPLARPVAKTPQPVAEPAPAPSPAPVVAPPPQAQPAVPAAPRAAARPDAASLVAQYRAAIMLQAARYKRYPRFARDNGWEGRVEVRLAIGPDGAIGSINVTRGSGYSILDRQALEMVRSAKPDAAIPEGLRGRPFSVDIPVIFSLRDADG